MKIASTYNNAALAALQTNPTPSTSETSQVQAYKAQQNPVEPTQRPELASDRLESASQLMEVETRISVDKDTHQMVVQVYNAQTDELIRELPPEKVREMSREILKLVGLQMDKRA